MKDIFTKLLLAFLSFGFASCAMQGNQTAATGQGLNAFKKGITSKKEAHQALGQPHDVRPQSSGTRWSYYYVTTRMNGLGLIPVVGLFLPDSNTTSVINHIYFDHNQKYSSHQISQKIEKKNSFASLGRAVDSFKNDTQHMRVKEEMNYLGLSFDEKEAIKAKDAGTILGANPQL